MKHVKKLWGSEKWIVNNKLYCGKLLTCKNRKWSSKGKYHYHKKKDETFFILEGGLRLDIAGRPYWLLPGNRIRIKPMTCHRFRSVGAKCKFIEFSTHHEDSDSYKTWKQKI